MITSRCGAAIRDILSVLNRRYRAASVIIYPTLVQGDTAAATIVKAIQTANLRNECDVLILARGGGSLEDLWPFNEESVAYAIYQSELPIVSGVGHEIDTTIADFVADLRAATPTAAAELITPDLDELLLALTTYKKQFARLIKQKLLQLQKNVVWVHKHLQQQHPKRRLHEQAQDLDLKEIALVRLQTKMLNDLQTKLQMLQVKLHHRTPTQRIRDINHRINLQQQTLISTMKKIVLHKQQSLANLATKLDGLSPLATLMRGFSIATRAKDHVILHDAKQVKRGEKIQVQLMKGSLECTVDDVT